MNKYEITFMEIKDDDVSIKTFNIDAKNFMTALVKTVWLLQEDGDPMEEVSQICTDYGFDCIKDAINTNDLNIIEKITSKIKDLFNKEELWGGYKSLISIKDYIPNNTYFCAKNYKIYNMGYIRDLEDLEETITNM